MRSKSVLIIICGLVLSLVATPLLGAQTPTPEAAPATLPAAAWLAPDTPTEGELSPEVAMVLYAFTGEAEQTISLAVTSDAETLDPLVILTKPDGTLVGWDDDSGEGLNAQLSVTLPSTGTYLALVSSIYALYLPSDAEAVSGAYTVSLTGTSAPSPEADFPTLDALGIPLITPEEPLALSLDTTTPLRWVGLRVQDSIILDVNATSENTDPLLYVFDETGQRIGLDDDSAETAQDAFIPALPLNNSGTYLMMVAAFDYHRALLRGITPGDAQLTIERVELETDEAGK